MNNSKKSLQKIHLKFVSTLILGLVVVFFSFGHVTLALEPCSLFKPDEVPSEGCEDSEVTDASPGAAAIVSPGSSATSPSSAATPASPSTNTTPGSRGGSSTASNQGGTKGSSTASNLGNGTTVSTPSFTLQNPLCNKSSNKTCKFDSVGGLLQGFIEIFTYLIILFAVLALIWTGLQYVLARGNPDEMKRLSNQLLYIVIGTAIVIGAGVIIDIVINTLSASGTVSSDVINSARGAIPK